MVSSHAIIRGIQRINNSSNKKNKKVNLKKIMSKDAYKRYFAYANNTSTIFRYARRNDGIYKYVLNKLSKKIITVYEVDFDDELKKFHHIRQVSEKYDV